MKITGLILILLSCTSLWFPSYAMAKDKGSSLVNKATSGDPRSRSIKFEDDVVEGMNENPYDSLENIAINDGRDHGHLYHRKANFHKEMKQIVQEAGYSR